MDQKKELGGMSHPDPLSIHILDTSKGLPARGVEVTLYRMGAAGPTSWLKVDSK